MNKRLILALAEIASLYGGNVTRAATPLGTGFTYQGQLKQDGLPLNGVVDLTFSLWDAAGIGSPPSGGNQIGANQAIAGVQVTNGLFTVVVNSSGQFGSAAFQGDAEWLQVSVNGTALSPRQETSAVPYSLGLRLPFSEAVSANTEAFGITNSGTGRAGAFSISSPANSSSALYARTGGTGPAVHADGVLQIGSNPGTSGELRLLRNGSASPVARAYTNVFGGNLDLFNADGNWAIRMWAGGPESDGYFAVARDVGLTGFLVNGNYLGDHEPIVNVVGSARSAVFEMGVPGNSSVRLPVDAISSSEILDEPGVAGSSEGTNPVTLDGTLQSVLSRTITCPADGYVIVIGTCQVQVFHTNGATSNADFGVSDSPVLVPGNQDVGLQFPSGAASGTYVLPVTVHGLFSATAGAHTYYLLAREFLGAYVVFDTQLSVLYVPTAYGTVAAAAAPSSARATGVLEQSVPVRPSLTAEDIAAEQAAAGVFHVARLERELAAMREDLEAVKRQLRARTAYQAYQSQEGARTR